jgi:hypothetical protein
MAKKLVLIGATLIISSCATPTPTAPFVPNVTIYPIATASQPNLQITLPTIRPTATPIPTATPLPRIIRQPLQGGQLSLGQNAPSLEDYWAGKAQFVKDVDDTGLPMGESETVVMSNGEVWSYIHASQRSAGVKDQCGNAVDFPGCMVIMRSVDGGKSFQKYANPFVCQIKCTTCPCKSETDHIDQQQYPRVFFDGETMFMVYEYRGQTKLRRSSDGLTWSAPEAVADTGIWRLWLKPCGSAAETIDAHPFVPKDYECLIGAPPGVYVEGDTLYVFVALGQNPSGMGCFVGNKRESAIKMRRCKSNPLFIGAKTYGPVNERGAKTNAFFDFRYISSADVVKQGDRYYMLYEGVRGPGLGDPGDTQFGLGIARSTTSQIDGKWERFANNPILVDMPGNIGLGHGDLVAMNEKIYLYTSLDGVKRSRLVLSWR